jgi:lysozyme
MISERGLAIIREFEGLRLHAYPDPASGGEPFTIGFGHTIDVEPGDNCTLEEAEQWLLDDCADAEVAILRHVKVPLSQGQLDALISFVFNLGAGNFHKSTLLRKLNAGDYVGAWQEFPRWNKAAGKVMPGLSRRRAAEAKLFAQSTSEKPTQISDALSYAEPVTAHIQPIASALSQAQIQEPSEEGSRDRVSAGAILPAEVNSIPQEQPMPAPLIPILAAVLPPIIQAIPALGKLFGSGSEVAERNVKAVEMAVGIVQEAVGAKNAQEAAEMVASDPAMAEVAQEAVKARWHELTEVGGGVEAARKADAASIAQNGPWWQVFRSPSFIVALFLLPLVYMIVGAVVGLFGAPFSEDVRAAIANGIVGLVLGGLIGYYYGQTTSRNRTTV